MSKRIYNFCAGPATLPEEVLLEAKESLYDYNNTGIGILEISHRSDTVVQMTAETASLLKEILGMGDDFEVLFLHGGASLQFHMVPLNLAKDKTPAYMNTGMWSQKAIAEAKRLGKVEVVASSEDRNFTYIPELKPGVVGPQHAYLHFTANNTIFGTQFKKEPVVEGNYLVCDASSDFLSKPIDITKYGLIYAGAQKNLGPAGLAVVLIRKELLKKSDPNLPPMLSYAVQAENGSMYNTPPVFPIYVVGLVLKWLKKMGGIPAMYQRNVSKAQILYDYLDQSSFYKGTVEKGSRSLMNIPFRLANPDLDKLFDKEATKRGLNGLKGHRSVGGMRASIYNAFPEAGVKALVEFMQEFEKTHG